MIWGDLYYTGERMLLLHLDHNWLLLYRQDGGRCSHSPQGSGLHTGKSKEPPWFTTDWQEPKKSSNRLPWKWTQIFRCLLLWWACTLNSNYWAVKTLKDYFKCLVSYQESWKVSQAEILEHSPQFWLVGVKWLKSLQSLTLWFYLCLPAQGFLCGTVLRLYNRESLGDPRLEKKQHPLCYTINVLRPRDWVELRTLPGTCVKGSLCSAPWWGTFVLTQNPAE